MATTQSHVSDFEHLSGDPKTSTILRYADAVEAKVTFHVSSST